MSSTRTSPDAAQQLAELRKTMARRFSDNDPPFWIENFDLSRNEFETRTSQTLVDMEITREPHFVLLSRAMSDYDEHWKDKDGS